MVFLVGVFHVNLRRFRGQLMSNPIKRKALLWWPFPYGMPSLGYHKMCQWLESLEHFLLKHPSVPWVVWNASRWPNPFAFQTIAHEDCQKVTVQNNLCFGKCGSIHFPGEGAHPHNFCSHCSPTKFTTTHLRLNCTSPTPVVKMVIQVEECQCMVKTEHGEERRLLAGSQDSFISGLPA